jgi:hypothetical protein
MANRRMNSFIEPRRRGSSPVMRGVPHDTLMKRDRLAALLALLLVGLHGVSAIKAQEILDVPPQGRENELAVMGGGIPVHVETNVLLGQLIQRLEGPWREVETGKGYWIGYTADMYSMAVYGEQAVQPLVEFIHASKSKHARYGALLTLHLIGIERRIAGRFIEHFKSQTVRNAFYGLLPEPELRDKVLLLLVRDPWPTDIPHLFKLLGQTDDEHCRALVNALFRYNLNNAQFGGMLPDEAQDARVFLALKDGTHELGALRVFTKEAPDERGERINQLLHTDSQVIIQWRPRGDRVVWKFTDVSEAQKRFHQYGYKLDLHPVICNALQGEVNSPFRYCDLDDPFNFNVNHTDVFIITPAAAKARWLTWWQAHAAEYKQAAAGGKAAKDSATAIILPTQSTHISIVQRAE